jgi:hypothetical protein
MTRVAQSSRNFGRASERCVSERPQCGEKDMTRAVGPATGRVTTCHGDHNWHGAGHVQRRVTPPGHGGHGTGHGIDGAGHSEHGDGERPAGPALPDVAKFAMLRPIYMLSDVNLTSQSPL